MHSTECPSENLSLARLQTFDFFLLDIQLPRIHLNMDVIYVHVCSQHIGLIFHFFVDKKCSLMQKLVICCSTLKYKNNIILIQIVYTRHTFYVILIQLQIRLKMLKHCLLN